MIIQIKPFRILCGTVADWEKSAYERGALATTLRRHSNASASSRAGWVTRREKRMMDRDARVVGDNKAETSARSGDSSPSDCSAVCPSCKKATDPAGYCNHCDALGDGPYQQTNSSTGQEPE
jgi:hypothetical protein